MEIKTLGTMKNGEEDRLFTLNNSKGMKVEIHSFGAGIYKIITPDRTGKYDDVVLGYANPDDYNGCDDYSGLVVGPVANRINGSFTLGGETFTPAGDSETGIMLHTNGDMSFKNWDLVSYTENRVVLSTDRKDSSQGLPGNIKATVTYTLTEDNELIIDYLASTDRTSYINLTNHVYFNLDGCAGGEIVGHLIKFESDYFVPTDKNSIPYGFLQSVENTPFDLRDFKKIEDGIDNRECDQTVWGRGYDHSLEIRNYDGTLRLAATVKSEKSGRKLECFTTLPAVQFYTGNFLAGLEGKYGFKNNFRNGFCLETQYHPDAVHHKDFVQPVFDENNPYRSRTVYKFTAE